MIYGKFITIFNVRNIKKATFNNKTHSILFYYSHDNMVYLLLSIIEKKNETLFRSNPLLKYVKDYVKGIGIHLLCSMRSLKIGSLLLKYTVLMYINADRLPYQYTDILDIIRSLFYLDQLFFFCFVFVVKYELHKHRERLITVIITSFNENLRSGSTNHDKKF